MSREPALRHAVAFSSGIRAIRNIERFLDVDSVTSPRFAGKDRSQLSSVVVWGRKQNAKRALQYADSRGLNVRYIEDGWIRTSSREAHSRCCYSLLVDDTGVYYDSENPSDIENYLNLPDNEFAAICDDNALEYARENRERMVRHCITKYNFCPKPEDGMVSNGKPLVLVIDQTRDDASVRFGGMQFSDFPAMLDRAIADNPGARVVVRTHPDVVAGRREGYLGEYAKRLGLEVSATGDNPMYWLKKAARVYVGTSQLGFEALMCGCKVSVAGLPFYAGWGLTDDWLTLARRVRTRTLDQVFHASHVYLARYLDPVSGAQWQLHECIDHVQVQLEAFERNAHSFACVGITPWKRGILAQYLRSPDGNIRFSRAGEVRRDERAVYWSYSDTRSVRGSSVAGCLKTNGVSRVEDGFIRSRGLGSDFVMPASLVVDHGGLFFDPASDSDLEALLNTFDCTQENIERSIRLKQSLLDTRLTKYNVASEQGAVPGPHKVNGTSALQVLVVGQVEDDQSILRGCVDVASNGALCRAVRCARPDAFIIYKPHPDVESGNRKGAVAPHILNECIDRVEHQRNFLNCLEECDELHTMTSLSGFEALLRGKAVHTYGMPFYAGWGLTQDHVQFQKRKRVRTLEELIYLCLVAYPRYMDIVSGEFITVEQLVSSLADAVGNDGPGSSGSMSVWKKLDNIRKAVNYKPI